MGGKIRGLGDMQHSSSPLMNEYAFRNVHAKQAHTYESEVLNGGK